MILQHSKLRVDEAPKPVLKSLRYRRQIIQLSYQLTVGGECFKKMHKPVHFLHRGEMGVRTPSPHPSPITHFLASFFFRSNSKHFQWLSGKESACNTGAAVDVGPVPGLGKSPGGGNGNLLQYSCQDSPIDRGAWWATVQRVAKNRTGFSYWAHKIPQVSLYQNSLSTQESWIHVLSLYRSYNLTGEGHQQQRYQWIQQSD